MPMPAEVCARQCAGLQIAAISVAPETFRIELTGQTPEVSPPRRPTLAKPSAQAAAGTQSWRLQPPSIFSYLDAVAHHGSIRKAAEALHIASSALNRRILDLEADVGSPLFERLPRGVRATAAGELFLAYVRRSLKELRLVEAQIDDLRGLVHGRVRIAVAESVTGYSAATGVTVIVLAWFGIISVMSSLIPVVAISPILLYIGMLIGSQAFQESPRAHAPAIVLALTPHLAAWGKLLIDNSLAAAGTNAHTLGFDNLGQVGVLYQGLEVMGGGSILGGLMLGAIASFVIDRAFTKAAAFAAAGAGMTFFGFMHGEAIGIGQSPLVTIAYLGVAGLLFGCAKFATVSAPAPEVHHHEHAEPVAAE